MLVLLDISDQEERHSQETTTRISYLLHQDDRLLPKAKKEKGESQIQKVPNSS